MGIADSPVIAPTNDVSGQVRIDDPTVQSPPGLGANVFKDRGAVERADSTRPQAVIIVPADNDAQGLDNDSSVANILFKSPRSWSPTVPDSIV